ncbi:putative lipoprotein [Exiguobacterium sp. S17]|nr:putative lipoprotein [Exiguobacterium sp. S17]
MKTCETKLVFFLIVFLLFLNACSDNGRELVVGTYVDESTPKM